MEKLSHGSLICYASSYVASRIPFKFDDNYANRSVAIVATSGSYFKSEDGQRWSITDMRRVSKPVKSTKSNEPVQVEKVEPVNSTSIKSQEEIKLSKLPLEILEEMAKALDEKRDALKAEMDFLDAEARKVGLVIKKRAYISTRITPNTISELSPDWVFNAYHTDRVDNAGNPLLKSKVLLRGVENEYFIFSVSANPNHVIKDRYLHIFKKRI